MKNFKTILLAFILGGLTIGLITNATLDACTGIKLKAKDNSFVHGRTLEFGIVIDTSIVAIPRGYEFIGNTPLGPGLPYHAKYSAVGAIAFGNPAILDGINEKGLAVGTFYFPGYAEYTPITSENQSKALSPVEFSNWIITQFATIEELKAALSHVIVVPTISKGWGNTPPPFHYIVYDKNGSCLVIEPLHGQLISYDNHLGVLTNSPTFDWHMTNLRNFINLTPFNAKPIRLNGVELSPFGQGSGMVGMPGDFTPPSRFLRASIFSATATPTNNSNEAVFQAFHILNQFDIPIGVVQQRDGDVLHSDFTMITCVRDPQTLKYYFKTYEDQSIKVVDLKKFELNTKLLKATTTGKNQVIEISSQLK